MPAAAGVVDSDEKGSEYILAHTGPRELDRHPLGGCGSGFGLVPNYTDPFSKGLGQHIIRCLKNKKCENERTNYFIRIGRAQIFHQVTGLRPTVLKFWVW